MSVGPLRVSGAVPLTATFIPSAAGERGKHPAIVRRGGYVGIATAAAAWHASFGAVLESTFGRAVVPLFPLNR